MTAWISPLPPEPTRIRFVTSYESDQDLFDDESKIGAIFAGEKQKERMVKPYGVHADGKGRIFVTDTACPFSTMS